MPEPSVQATDIIRTHAELRAIYPQARTSARSKVQPRLTVAMRRWLASSSFFMLSSHGPDGVDCSPRGDEHGQAFLVQDAATIIVPDRRGNNRINSLSNLLDDDRVALLFLIPGINQALRVKGRAKLSVNPVLLQRFEQNGERPRTVLLITVSSAYVQNARALQQSGLWEQETRTLPENLPTAGELAQPDPIQSAPTYDGKPVD